MVGPFPKKLQFRGSTPNLPRQEKNINALLYFDWRTMTAGKRSAGKKRLGPLSAEEFDAANRAFFRLYQSSNLLHKVGTRSVSSLGTTTQQWAVIGALARPADRDMGLTVKALMELLTVSRQTITPLLDRLEQRGWLERVRNGA